jgi:hypothetical protein
MNASAQIKVIGGNGQLSLGKEFAGKTVLINRLDDGTWIIKPGAFVPDSEKWLHQGEGLAKLERALTWAEQHPAKDSFSVFAKKVEGGDA